MNSSSLSRDDILRFLADAPAVAVSACLLGIPCRYDGKAKNASHALLNFLLSRPSLCSSVQDEPERRIRGYSELRKAFQKAEEREDVHPLGADPLLRTLLPKGVFPICPEIFGGLSCPRLPADFFGGSGEDLLHGSAVLINRAGEDVTSAFLLGAQSALSIAEIAGVTAAVLKEGSPSCGVGRVQCNGVKISGSGVTSCLFQKASIRRFTEEDLSPIL